MTTAQQGDLKGIEDAREVAVELNIDDRTDDGGDPALADTGPCCGHGAD